MEGLLRAQEKKNDNAGGKLPHVIRLIVLVGPDYCLASTPLDCLSGSPAPVEFGPELRLCLEHNDLM